MPCLVEIPFHRRQCLLVGHRIGHVVIICGAVVGPVADLVQAHIRIVRRPAPFRPAPSAPVPMFRRRGSCPSPSPAASGARIPAAVSQSPSRSRSTALHSVPTAVVAVMKFAAADRIKLLPEWSKKIHGLSVEKSQNVGGANVPSNVTWSKFFGYCVKLGNVNVLAASAAGLTHREQDVRVILVAANRRVPRHARLEIERDFAVPAQAVGARARLEVPQREFRDCR